MNRPLRLAAGLVAASAGIALALAAPAQAAPAHAHAHAHATHHAHVKAQRSPKGHAFGKLTKAERRLAIVKNQVTRQITVKNAALTRIAGSDAMSAIDPADAAVLAVSISTDQAGLTALQQAVSDSTTVADAKSVGSQVRQVKPAVYWVAVSALTQAAVVQTAVADNTATIADLSAQADALEAAGQDVSTVRTALAAATQANGDAAADATAAHDLALTLTAESSHADVAAVGTQLEAAAAALDTVAAELQVAQDAITALQAAAAPVVSTTPTV